MEISVWLAAIIGGLVFIAHGIGYRKGLKKSERPQSFGRFE